MEESIKIQEEFENLIEQLERLKNINELTSSNAESSQKVITQIDKFVLSINEYKKKLEEDLTLKSESIEKLILHLDKSIDSMEVQTQALTKNINSSFSILNVETNSNFTSLETNIIEYHSKQINNLIHKIDENKNDFTKKLETQVKEIKTIKTILFIICGLIVIGIVTTMLK